MPKYLIFIFIFLSLPGISQVSETVLKADWKFREFPEESFYQATVPGTIHTDLQNNKSPKALFLEEDEKKERWIENEIWEYTGTFNCDKSTLNNKHIVLKFEGIDTYATISLNGSKILDCNNMFRVWEVDVKKYLKPGKNSLDVTFEPAVKKGKTEAAKLPYTLPGDERVFSRKAQYQYGWDWGPRFVTCGIYKPIKLITWNDVRILSVNHEIEQLNDSIAKIAFIIKTENDIDQLARLNINTFHGEVNIAKLQYNHNYRFDLKKGIQTDTFNYTIHDPKRWYSNGLGEPNLYGCDISVRYNKTETNYHTSIGLRTLELVREKDFFGESFYFKLNGKPVFMKGANYIPQDNFVSRTTPKDYQKIVQMAKDANMNMLRVWGGGLYADDAFYNECDKNGILVWQDFMFACAMYPGDSVFVENVKQEVTQLVTRLQNHPCLALWCGNNENDEGWQNWGWQKQYNYSKQDSSKIWNDYKHLFQKTIPSIVKQIDPQVNYWSSSPSIGWGHKESLLQGDSHYWGVWWGMEPFDLYEKKVGRFMSEYGFQGMPDLQTFKTFCDSNQLSLTSQPVKAHQKHPTGYQTIQTYMERDYKVPTDFKKYIYSSQLLQRDGMKIAIEAHRRAKPYCMGTLYWQFNDCWPVTSWSAIDYTCKPKALYYETKKLYNDVIISVKQEREGYNVYVISDKQTDTKAELTIYLKNMKGDILFQKKQSVTINANNSRIYYTLTESELKNLNKQQVYLSSYLTDSKGTEIAKSFFCFVKAKELQLEQPQIKVLLSKDKNSLSVSSSSFVKDLFLFSNNDLTMNFSENYFDLEAGETIIIKLNSEMQFSRNIEYISLYDINH